MSWRKYNKLYNSKMRAFDIYYVKVMNKDLKKFRAVNWLKANYIRRKK